MPALLTTRSTPPKASTAALNAVGDLLLGRHVDGDRDGLVRPAELLGDGGGVLAR